MFKRFALTISLVIVLLVSTTRGLAQDIDDYKPAASELAEHVPGELLIRFSPGTNSARAAKKMAEMGVTQKREIPAIGVHLVKLPPGLSVEQAMDRFNRRPGVEYTEPNYIMQIAAASQAEITDQWGLTKIQTQAAWDTLDENQKNEVILATVDTGIDSSQSDLSANIYYLPDEIPNNGLDDDNNGYVDDNWGWDFVNNDNDPSDDNMHGTAVSSVMVAAEDGAGIVGICPWCKVLAVKAMGANGTGSLDVVANGITYAAENGAKVINLSLTGPAGSQTLEDAVNFAWNQGAVVVAAAGNEGLKTTRYPAGYANAMSVASTNSEDNRSCFSNYDNGYISVAAPGEAIYVIDINNTETGYGYYSGTSLSTPLVAGLAGILFGKDPDDPELDNNLVRTIIENSAVDLGLSGVDSTYGHGRIDAFRALTGDYTQVTPPVGLYSTSDTASGYAHARKLVRDSTGILHLIWHTNEGSLFRIRYATSSDDGSSWDLQPDVFSSPNETFHPALATDGEYLFVAIPSRTGPDTNYPYEILFTRKSLSGGSWEPTQSLMGGTDNAVRPDIYFDPTNGGRLHVIASSLDDAPYLYYRGSDTQGVSWDAVSQFNPSNSTPNTRYATIHANGDNIYVATKTMDQVCVWIFCYTYFYLHTARSTDGGLTWIDQEQISSFQAQTSSEYGVSLAGVGDRVYMGYEVYTNLYFRRYDGAGWSSYLELETGAPTQQDPIIYKWPTITQAEDGQAWMMFEEHKQLYMRHYDGSNWQEKESLGSGTYANLKLGTQGGQVEWLYTNCNGSPFDLVYGSRSLSGNNSPVADDQGVTTAEDTPKGIILTASDLEGDPLTFNVVTGPANGGLSGTAPNLTYTPDQDFNGGDSFTFVANDGTTNSNTATVTITVTAVNDPPVADDQGVATAEDTPVGITLSANDVDVDPLTYSVVSGPTDGSLSGTTPNLTYTPNPGYNGLDSFTFIANDGFEDSNTATVDINVSQVNNPPVADDKVVATDEDIPVGITLTASDPDSDPLTYSVVTGPANGTLGGTEPSLTYTPGANYNGQDSFTFVANDGFDDSNTATVTITVTAVNDQPLANSQVATTDEDTPLAITLTGSDIEGSPLTFSVVTGPAHGALTGMAPNLTYTPDMDYFGPDIFTFKVKDGSVDSSTATVSISVNPVNDPPVADNKVVGGDEDTAVAITLTGSDVEGDALTFSLLSIPVNGSLGGAIPNLNYTPDPNFNGQDSFTYQATDGTNNSNIATVTIELSAVNDAPSADDQGVTTDEDMQIVITLTASDVEGNPLTYSIVSGPSNGALSGAGSNWAYTPDPDYNGLDSFTFRANDGTIDSNTATVSITINPVNDAPVASNKGVTTAEDTAVGIVLTASDLDGDALTYSIVTGPSNGTLSGSGSNRTYTPDPDYNGADSFTFRANDGSTNSNTATVSLTINPVNDAPVADNQAAITSEDTAVDITLTASDVEGNPLTYSIVSGPSNGTLSGSGSNRTYTPDRDYNGADSFTFRANDGTIDSNTATVSITINPVNDAPVADDQAVITAEDTAVDITLTASDLDDDTLTYRVVSGSTNGTLSGTAPNLTYTPNPGYEGADSFTFRANDGLADSNLAAVNITVNPAAIVVEATASGEIFVAGTVTGSYTNTLTKDGIAEQITERDSGGKPINRFSYLEHKWTIDVVPGNAVTLYANAWSSGSTDGDSFVFAYSTDDVTYTDMFTVSNLIDIGYEEYSLPATTQGTVYVRVTDKDHTRGNRRHDTVYVDHLYIRSETQPGDPPNAPTNLLATAVSATQIDLTWDSDADNKLGFKIERSPDGNAWSVIGTVGENELSYNDTGLSPNTIYYYRVRAYNASGSSNYSDVASTTTEDGLSLTATGSKVKGVHEVYLEWSGGAATSFDIYRDGLEIDSGIAGNSYPDNTGNKGSASYQYQVCEAGNPSNCSNIVQVDF